MTTTEAFSIIRHRAFASPKVAIVGALFYLALIIAVNWMTFTNTHSVVVSFFVTLLVLIAAFAIDMGLCVFFLRKSFRPVRWHDVISPESAEATLSEEEASHSANSDYSNAKVGWDE